MLIDPTSLGCQPHRLCHKYSIISSYFESFLGHVDRPFGYRILANPYINVFLNI